MADIELVIKISEDIYKDIIENRFIYDEDNRIVADVIKNSTPLPKGHGDLIDRDKLEDEFGIEDADIYANDVIRSMPVIIPRV